MSLISNFFNFIITYPIFNVLMLLFHLFGDFALSIIVLTIVITTALLPLTWRHTYLYWPLLCSQYRPESCQSCPSQ